MKIDTDRHQTELWLTWKEWVALNARRNFELAQTLYKNEKPTGLPDKVRVRKSSKRKSGEDYVSDMWSNAGSSFPDQQSGETASQRLLKKQSKILITPGTIKKT